MPPATELLFGAVLGKLFRWGISDVRFLVGEVSGVWGAPQPGSPPNPLGGLLRGEGGGC